MLFPVSHSARDQTLAELKGEDKLYDDLLICLVIGQEATKRDYARASCWVKKLYNAFADGINYYLWKHPQVQPALLNKGKVIAGRRQQPGSWFCPFF